MSEMSGQYYKKRQPSFCIVDDDCRLEAYTILKPILESRGAKGTFAAITGEIGSVTRMTLAQMLDLQANGHEFISHTQTHRQLTSLTEAEIITEFEESTTVLKEYGMTSDVLAYPNGLYNKQIVEIAKKYFKCAMDTGDWLNTSPLHTYSLSRLGLGAWGISDLASIEAKIDTIIANKSLCILMTHVGDNTAEQNTLISQVLDYIIGLGYEIKIFSDAYEEHTNLLDCGEYNEATDQSELVIGCDGIMGGVGANPIVTNVILAGTVLSTTPATDFEDGKITYSGISNEVASGFPQSIGGTLMTNRVVRDSIYIYQEYTPYMSTDRYIRYWNPYTPVWSAWKTITNYKNSLVKVPTFDTGCSGFDPTITITSFTNGEAGNAPTPNVGGILITNNFVGYYGYAFQEYHPVSQAAIYKRCAISENNWSVWSLITAASGSSRPVSVYIGNSFFDTSLNKPIWCKTIGAKEVEVLTITREATNAGAITITLNGVAINVTVSAGDTIGTIGNKILGTSFPGWVVTGTTDSGVITFTRRYSGVCSAAVFTDTASTGTTATIAKTTSGTATIWVDANGTVV
ncbi:MAG: hypothetical protein K0S01_2388 [Herbinix sp.]|jgi:hypothetical protein|nr:hypothetical protein [Herbinix sp.]